MAEAIKESVVKTAPGAIGHLIQFNEKVAKIPKLLLSWIPMLGKMFKNAPETIKKSTKEQLARILHGKNFLSASARKSDIEEIQIEAQKCLEKHESPADLDFSRRVDAITKDIWSDVPAWKKVTAHIAGPFVALGGILAFAIAPIDWGHSIILMASAKEILAATGLGGLAHLVAVEDIRSEVNKMMDDVALAQLSNLHAALCDAAGVPRSPKPVRLRPDLAEPMTLPEPTIDRLACKHNLIGEPWLELDGEALDRIKMELA
jgi:hypothetical protein